MKQTERQLLEARKARDGARRALYRRIAQVRTDVNARGICGRILDRAGEELWGAVDMALDVARESKAVIAGTGVALALWFLRAPIVSWARRRFDPEREE